MQVLEAQTPKELDGGHNQQRLVQLSELAERYDGVRGRRKIIFTHAHDMLGE